MKLFNTLLIILITLSVYSTAHAISYSQLEGNQAELSQSAQTEPVNYTEDDDEC